MEWDASPQLMARLRASIVPLEPAAPLKEVLAQDFPKDCANLPIAGGWGRAKERPIVFIRTPASLDGAERFIAGRIITEELITFQPFESRFTGLDLREKERQRIKEERTFDRVAVTVDCWSEKHWHYLANEYMRHDTWPDKAFDLAALLAKRNASQITYDREFWFDVTDVQGQG